jgi:hypothetical protein
MFVEKEQVVYKGMCGIIAFVCNEYVVIELPPKKERKPPRLLVFPENYKNIITDKQSTK